MKCGNSEYIGCIGCKQAHNHQSTGLLRSVDTLKQPATDWYSFQTHCFCHLDRLNIVLAQRFKRSMQYVASGLQTVDQTPWLDFSRR